MKEIRTNRISRFRRWTRKGWAAFASLHRRVTIGVLSVSMSILLPTAAAARTGMPDTLAISRTVQVDEVDVTAALPVPVRSVVPSVPLLDRDAVAAAPFQTLESALRSVPAVDLRERGGKGVQADISLRGGSSDQTMVLLNGIDFTDARTGHQSHALPVDLDCISSVELLDGVTGIGAFAGAVNLRTRPLRPTYLRAEGFGGAYGYGGGSLSGAVTEGTFSLFAAASLRRSDGYMHNTDFRNWNTYVRMNGSTPRAGFFDFQGGFQDRVFGSNGFYAAYNPDQYEKTRTLLASLRWVRRFGRTEASAAVRYRKVFDRYDWTRGTPLNRHNTDQCGAEFRVVRPWGWGTTSAGADWSYAHIFSTNLGHPLAVPHGCYTRADARHTGHLWISHAKRWGRFEAAGSAGAALSPYGTAALWSLSGGYRPSDGVRLDLSVASSMRLPTFTDLYYTSPAQLNNPDLGPERAVTWSLGADLRQGGWSASMHLFCRDGRDIIDWVWRPELGDRWHSEQESRLVSFGAELVGGYRSGRGAVRRATLSYGCLTQSRRSDVIVSSSMDYMRHKVALLFEVAFLRRCTFVLTGTLCDRYGGYTYYLRDADGELLTDGSGGMLTERRDFRPYFLVDARLSWEKGVVRLYVDATNLTDTRYCDFGGVPLPGRWLTGGAVLTIGG